MIIACMETRLCAAIIIENGRMLLVHNAKHTPARIEPPGGKIMENESPEEALKREVMEELGVEVRVLEFIGSFTTTSPEGAFDVESYRCTIISGSPSIVEPHIIPDFAWLAFDELLKMKATGRLAPNLAGALEVLKGLL